MNPKRPSVVGLWVTRSMPRNSAPWGGMGGSSAAAAGAIQAALIADPSEGGRCPQRDGGCPLQKKATVEATSTVLRHCIPRFVGRSTLSRPGAKPNLPRLARACQACLSKHGAVRSPRPQSHLPSGRFHRKRGPGVQLKGRLPVIGHCGGRGNRPPRKQQKPQTAAVERPLLQPEVHSAQALGHRRSRPRRAPCPLRRPP